VLARIFIVVGSLVVAALFAALIAPYFVDWTDFRHDFENQASRIIGKKVVVHGEVDARLLPFPSASAKTPMARPSSRPRAFPWRANLRPS